MAKSLSYLKKLFDDPARFRLAKAVARPQAEEIARGIARQIESGLGDLPQHKAASWIAAARELGASVRPLAEGETAGPMYDWVNKTIIYDPDQDEWVICRNICHELAHHLLCHPREGAIRNGTELYDDWRQTLQHRIAQAVEAYFFGK